MWRDDMSHVPAAAHIRLHMAGRTCTHVSAYTPCCVSVGIRAVLKRPAATYPPTVPAHTPPHTSACHCCCKPGPALGTQQNAEETHTRTLQGHNDWTCGGTSARRAARFPILWWLRKELADLDLPHKSQEECVPRGVSKVSPCFEGEESIFGHGCFSHDHWRAH